MWAVRLRMSEPGGRRTCGQNASAPSQTNSGLLVAHSHHQHQPSSFPSLEDLMNQVADQVCQAAVDKINSHIPSGSDPWQSVGGSL